MGLILRHAKMDYGDVVSCTVYLTDLDDYDEMNKAYSPYFPKDPPARTCVQVAKLVRGGQGGAVFYRGQIKGSPGPVKGGEA